VLSARILLVSVQQLALMALSKPICDAKIPASILNYF